MKAKTRSPLIPLFLIVFVDILGLTIILPLFPFYAEKFGATPAVVGSLVSVYAVCQFIAGPILGNWSDRFGRRPVLIISQIGTLIGFLVLAMAQSLWMLFLGRIIDGITAGNITVAQAYISDVTPPEGRVKAYGIIGVSFGLGFLLGPAISGALVSYGMSAPIYAAAFLSFLSIMGTIFILPKRPPANDTRIDKGLFISVKTWRRFFAHPELAPVLIQFFLFNWIFTSFTSGFAMFAERRFLWKGEPFGAREVGFVMAALGLYGVLLQGGLIGRLNKKFGEIKLVAAGFLTSVIGYLMLAKSFDLSMLALAMIFSAFGSGVLRPALTALLSQSVDATEQGLVMGVAQSLGSIAQILAPLLVGALIGHDLLSGWANLLAMFSAFALALVWRERRRV